MTKAVFLLTHSFDHGAGDVALVFVHSSIDKALEHMAYRVREDIARGGAWSRDDLWNPEDKLALADILTSSKYYARLLDVYPKGPEWFSLAAHVPDAPDQTIHMHVSEDVRAYVERAS